MAGTCTCSGTGINGPVTIGCGEQTCGTDNNLYACTGQDTWAPTGNPCPAPPDLTPPCTCSGTGINGPVTVNCGQSTCGTDNNLWTCAAQDTWTGPGNSCNAPPPDLSGGGGCTCSGVGLNGPVTINCGQQTCGTDNNFYACTAQDTWAPTGNSCTAPPPDLSGPACTCSGTGLNGPVTVNCGQGTCGTDNTTYQCTAQDTWTPTGNPCTAPPDMTPGCTCSGTGINGPVTVSCGQNTCGTDSNLYACTAQDTWTPTGNPCPPPDMTVPPDLTAGCTCSGTGINGPVTVNCGQQTCGVDSLLYFCSGHDTWVGTGNSCT
jgi:hypothetical protein